MFELILWLFRYFLGRLFVDLPLPLPEVVDQITEMNLPLPLPAVVDQITEMNLSLRNIRTQNDKLRKDLIGLKANLNNLTFKCERAQSKESNLPKPPILSSFK